MWLGDGAHSWEQRHWEHPILWCRGERYTKVLWQQSIETLLLACFNWCILQVALRCQYNVVIHNLSACPIGCNKLLVFDCKCAVVNVQANFCLLCVRATFVLGARKARNLAMDALSFHNLRPNKIMKASASKYFYFHTNGVLQQQTDPCHWSESTTTYLRPYQHAIACLKVGDKYM